jgi:glutamate synthase domain-containing protein 3
VAIGDSALFNNGIGAWSFNQAANNTAVGSKALYTNTRGYDNTAIGFQSGFQNSTGSGNVFIGYKAGYNETGNEKLYIDNSDTSDPLILGDFANDKLKVNGTLEVNGALEVNGSMEVNGAMEVTSQIQISSSNDTPQSGMVRWNDELQDFEGYNGTEWVSFTKANSSTWGTVSSTTVNENFKIAPTSSVQSKTGTSVSKDGDYMIVGSPQGGGTIQRGRAYIYYYNGTSWMYQALLAASDGEHLDNFGISVSIKGDYAIIGAYKDDVGTGSEQGSAYIFHRSGNVWTQQIKITAPDGADSDMFGCSVAIDGDYAIIGAKEDDIGSNANQGSAYIFFRSGTTWTQQAKLVASDGEAADAFGNSVSIDGAYTIIGAEGDNIGSNVDQGSAYIFFRSGTNWAQQAKLVASDGGADVFFGCSVSIDEDFTIIGASHDAIGSNASQGSAYIFERNGTVWEEQEKLTAIDVEASGLFGFSVSIDGNLAIIGAAYDHIGTIMDQGSAYIYEYNGYYWTKVAKLIASDGNSNDLFGYSVCIDENITIIGSPMDDIGIKYNHGSAYIFTQQ